MRVKIRLRGVWFKKTVPTKLGANCDGSAWCLSCTFRSLYNIGSTAMQTLLRTHGPRPCEKSRFRRAVFSIRFGQFLINFSCYWRKEERAKKKERPGKPSLLFLLFSFVLQCDCLRFSVLAVFCPKRTDCRGGACPRPVGHRLALPLAEPARNRAGASPAPTVRNQKPKC